MDMHGGTMTDMSANPGAEHMHMHSGMMGEMSANHSGSFMENLAAFFGFFGRLAADILVTLTSGPILHFLAALVLLLASAVLLRVLLTRQVPKV